MAASFSMDTAESTSLNKQVCLEEKNRSLLLMIHISLSLPLLPLLPLLLSLQLSDPHLEVPGPKKPCTVLGGREVVPPGFLPDQIPSTEPTSSEPTSSAPEKVNNSAMTSKDYYFDSYSHFGEGCSI